MNANIDNSLANKKRKPYTTLACELCRKRKVRCENDGDGTICERCKNSGTECRYGKYLILS